MDAGAGAMQREAETTASYDTGQDGNDEPGWRPSKAEVAAAVILFIIIILWPKEWEPGGSDGGPVGWGYDDY